MRNHVIATAASMEQQSAVTRDMSATMQGAVRAIDEITGGVSAISSAVEQVSGAVSTPREAARVLVR